MATPDLDAMLTPEQCAEWLQITTTDLGRKSSGDKPKIPAFRPTREMVRFHPRTILAKMAKDNGVSLDVIAASYGIRMEGRT